jgi:very-short-patch-repair endonuclease
MRRFRDISRRLRRDQTSAEARLWRELRAHRFEDRKFRRQHQIGGYIVDFVCLDAKLVIEVDGDTHGSEAEIARDAVRTAALEQAGFAVVRVQNDDVRSNLAGVLDTIWMELHHRTTL